MAKTTTKTQAPKGEAPDTTTVADIPITGGEDQTVVSDGPIGEPKGNRRGTKKKAATSGAQSASDASKAPATPTSKTLGKRGTGRVGTKESTKAAKAPAEGATRGKKGEPKPSSAITMAQLADSYAKHLEALGKSHGTVHSYGIEMKTAVRHFGAETKIVSLTAKSVGAYFDSDTVTKNRKGREKDEKTVAKTRRVLRLALTWLAEVGVLQEAPIPEVKKPSKKK